MMASSFKYVILLAAVVAVSWWVWRTTHSTWFALPSAVPMYRPADFTRRNDGGKTIEYRVGSGTANPANLPADYVVRDPEGLTDYLGPDGKPTW